MTLLVGGYLIFCWLALLVLLFAHRGAVCRHCGRWIRRDPARVGAWFHPDGDWHPEMPDDLDFPRRGSYCADGVTQAAP